MLTFIIRRSVLALLTIWVLSMISFFVIQLPPGDFVDTYVQQLLEGGGDFGNVVMEEALGETLREQYGLNKPVYVQYSKWAWKLLHFDLGMSLISAVPVKDLILERLLMTVILAGTTAAFAWGLSIPIGIYSAVRQHSIGDYTFTFIGFLGLAVPDFLLALWLMWMAFTYFPDHSIGGLFSPEYLEAPWSWTRVQDLLSHLWIAAFVVGTAGTAALIRVMRANLLDELNKPYVEAARAKGVSPWRLVIKYPTRIALNPFISTAGLEITELFSGSLIVATVMSLPTVGPLLLRALISQDMFMAGSILLILTTLTLVGMLISDLMLAALDPRIRMTH